jgi:hypothetical protein
MSGSLDYIYIPAADVDGETRRYVQTLGAELVWKVRGMGTTAARLRLDEPGPAILLHPVRELEIPHGPCATFTMEAGQRYAVYQLTRPDAVHHFDGRIDP